MTRIYVTRPLPRHILSPLSGWDVVVYPHDEPVPHSILTEELRDAEGVLTMLTDPVDSRALAEADRLKVVSQMAVGVDNIDLEACRRRGVRIGHTPDVLTEIVADTAWALLASVVRRLPEGSLEVAEGRWGPWAPFHLTGGELFDSTIGIVGMGRIGRAVARRAEGFGMEVIYNSPRSDVGRYRRVDLAELLELSDHVILCASLTQETRSLIGEEELSAMKPTAYLVNIARGGLVDTAALVGALRSGEIAGAALDVTDPEPLPADHPLMSLSNCQVTPHIASASVRTRTAMATLAVENLVSGMGGGPMPAEYPGGG